MVAGRAAALWVSTLPNVSGDSTVVAMNKTKNKIMSGVIVAGIAFTACNAGSTPGQTGNEPVDTQLSDDGIPDCDTVIAGTISADFGGCLSDGVAIPVTVFECDGGGVFSLEIGESFWSGRAGDVWEKDVLDVWDICG